MLERVVSLIKKVLCHFVSINTILVVSVTKELGVSLTLGVKWASEELVMFGTRGRNGMLGYVDADVDEPGNAISTIEFRGPASSSIVLLANLDSL